MGHHPSQPVTGPRLASPNYYRGYLRLLDEMLAEAKPASGPFEPDPADVYYDAEGLLLDTPPVPDAARLWDDPDDLIGEDDL